MRRAIGWAWLVFLAVITITAFPQARGLTPGASEAVAQAINVGYLENVTFERLPGKERVRLAVSRQSGVTVESQTGNAVLVRMENLFVPEGLRRPLQDPAFSNVVRVTPVQKSAEGRSWVIATIELKQKVPYSVRQEGMNILIDFNVTSVAAAGPVLETPLRVEQTPATPAPQTAEKSGTPTEKAAIPGGDAGKEKKSDQGPRIFLDVQDADIKSVLRLLAEQGNVSIVSGDDVKGTLTLNIKDVPWEQALDTILDLKGLTKKREGNVITAMTLEKMRKDEAERAAMEKAKKDEADRMALEMRQKEEADQIREPAITRVVPIAYNNPEELKKNVEELLKSKNAADGKSPGQPADRNAASNQSSITVDNHTRSLIIRATRRDMDSLLRFIERIDKPTEQILIKANIVETTKSTARNLGIQWGGMWGQRIGSQGLYVTPGGTGGSTTPPGSAFNGDYSPISGVKGIAGQGFGVNFPAAGILGVSPASLGVMFGSIGGNILDLQLSALQKDGKLNILSSPSLVTLDNQTASTENGEDVPFVTPASANQPATVTWKKAVLRLEIKPHVIDGKHIKLTIIVKKDEADFSRSVQGNPPIVVKETKTDLVVADGETVVISGFTKQRKDDAIDGVPWLKEVPVLGWLFKGEGKSESMEEVLIFITPNIMKPQTEAGIQEGA